MKKIKIEKNVPITENKKREYKYPFDQLKAIKDSFLVESKDPAPLRNLISVSGYRFKKANPNFNFTIKVVEKGVRVWRIKAQKRLVPVANSVKIIKKRQK